ncbi:hypothetical protein HAZT_HAZT006615 [Hyalella azteca]|uniref:Reverse transcriptase domain-containing protein n=1 Tax=Hyalella azteca TaxID=294128 RepID=A0A6A0GXM4_HYAAZ|nr:hypothetical protein HAZT_HAZT006615 [Hyalella azteca]
MFRAVSGRLPPSAIPLTAAAPLTPEGTAEALAAHFAKSLSHRCAISPTKEIEIERALICEDDSAVNCRFTLEELLRGMRRLKTRSSPGADLIHNAFLAHLPPAHHSALLAIFNQSFRLAELPREWQTSLVIPIPKPQKDPCAPSSHRPISLLSCEGKLM